jgi:guanylate kinase
MNKSSAHPGLLVVISGPSGVGKTTITHALVDKLGAVFSVSMTTRPRTSADAEGVDYFFVDVRAGHTRRRAARTCPRLRQLLRNAP